VEDHEISSRYLNKILKSTKKITQVSFLIATRRVKTLKQ
jgi:hypothetical protein